MKWQLHQDQLGKGRWKQKWLQRRWSFSWKRGWKGKSTLRMCSMCADNQSRAHASHLVGRAAPRYSYATSLLLCWLVPSAAPVSPSLVRASANWNCANLIGALGHDTSNVALQHCLGCALFCKARVTIFGTHSRQNATYKAYQKGNNSVLVIFRIPELLFPFWTYQIRLELIVSLWIFFLAFLLKEEHEIENFAYWKKKIGITPFIQAPHLIIKLLASI